MTVNAQQDRNLGNKEITDSLWSPLTEIEVTTLSNAHLAKSGNPDALLALAIMASGDSRSKKEFSRIKNIINRFVTRIKPRISQQTNIWRKGFELHSAMHDEFFLGNQPQSDLQGYSANQSQFSRIFKDKTFNCISSSMLFLVLARYFDLPVEGVILPTHSYVQLTTPEGRVIEIETTTKTGYGIRHNQAFYESNERQNWFQRRNLVATTYQDYLNREVVSAYELIVDNMNHQHVAKNKMAQVDRYRLQEIRGWLLPENLEAQLFRWYVINNELIRLKTNQQTEPVKQLIKVAESLIAQYLHDGNLDDRVNQIISFIYTSKASFAFEEKNYAASIDHFNEALRWVSEKTQATKIVRNINIALVNQGNLFSSNKDYSSAIKFYAQAYANVNKNSQENSSNIDRIIKQQIENNIGTAYWNMSVPYLNKGDSYSAHELLNECKTRYPKLEKCQQGINKICQSYSLPACQQ